MKKRRTRSAVTGSKRDLASDRRAALQALPTMGAGELRRFKLSKDLLENQLTDTLGVLIKELTGLQLHLLWHEAFDVQRPGRALRLCPDSKKKEGLDGRVSPTCEACLERDWRPVVAPFDEGTRSVGPCGVMTFRVAIEIAGKVSPLTLALQAAVEDGKGKPRGGVSAAKFEQGIALLRVLKRDLEMALRAATAEAALARLHTRLPVLRKEARLVKTIRQQQGAFSAHPILPGGDSHAQRIAQKMIAHVHDHFHRPMSLSQVAAALAMNASYLSDLFSRQLGMTFHHYLLEVRMAKARQLLLSPHRRISEVAGVVGYASADQFRHAFKAHAGVPPSQWR